MTTTDIIKLRLWNQKLTQTQFSDPAELVAWFGAVQSQDYPAAVWVVGQRLQHATLKTIEDAFNNGAILRTHVMRPTWHFVHPQDIRWMLKLTAPRVKAIMKYYYTQLGLDEKLLKKTQNIFTDVLQGKKQLTRMQLSEALHKKGIAAIGQKLGHIVGEAELDGILCSGPKIGSKFTYMLLEERAPKTPDLSHDEAVALLTKKYFQSHGPATVKDFSWWSGLTVIDAKKGIALNTSLESKIVNEKTYYFFNTKPQLIRKDISLLPNYDEYTIAYKERELFFNPEQAKKLPPVGRAVAFSHTIVKDGKIIGMYRRGQVKNTIVITPKFFNKPTAEEIKELQKTVGRYKKFLDEKVILKD